MNLSSKGCQIKFHRVEGGRKHADKPKGAGNQPDLSSRSKRESRKILSRGLGSHQNFLIGNLRRRGPLRKGGQLEVVDNPVDHT
jgi:hypothetical protein